MLRRGFTILEVLVAATLLGVGVAAVLGGIKSVNAAEGRARELEVMQRLAVDKLEELKATTDTFAAGDNGDFVDRNLDDYVWEMQVEPTGIEYLDGVTVTVRKRSEAEGDPVGQVSTLVFEGPEPTTEAAP